MRLLLAAVIALAPLGAAAQQTGQSASTMQTASGEMAGQVTGLESAAEGFLRAARAG